MIELIIQNIGAFSIIGLILFVAIIIIVYLFNNKFKEHINDNWIKFRDNPFFLFFGGLFKKDESDNVVVATFKNFVRFIQQVVKKMVDVLLWPFIQLAGVFVKMLGRVSGTFNIFRGQFAVMRTFMFKLTEGVLGRLNNLNTAFTMFFLKAREGLKKQAAIFNLIAWTVAHSYYFLYSAVAGPVGNFFKNTGRLQLPIMDFIGGPPLTLSYIDKLCFHPETLIKSMNREKKISEIGFDENLIGKMKVMNRSEELYRIGNSRVSGCHYIKSDGIFERNCKVKDLACEYGIMGEIYNDNLFCLITKDGEIKTADGCIYGDYLDGFDNKRMGKMLKMNEMNLNFDYSKLENRIYDKKELFKIIKNNFEKEISKDEIEDDVNNKVWGYSEDSILLTNAGEISIHNINEGDYLDGNLITAKIRISPGIIDVYELEGVKLSKNNLIWRDNKWIRVKDCVDAVYIGKNEKEYINFIISKSIYYVKSKDGMIITRDYLEIEDKEWNEYIEEKSLDFLNSLGEKY